MQQDEKQTIQSIISQVININEKYKEIKKIKGDNFNIFSILKLERYEVQTHSNFIHELLSPEGSHNQGTLFLELFLKNLPKLEDYGNIKNVHQEYLTNQNRRIDFVIETEKYQIGIEMKIDAGDQNKQLFDYKNELDKAKKESRLYYLTLTGYEASEESTNNSLKINEDYFLLSFKDDIYAWIEACIEQSSTIPLLREGLVHYKNLIGKITNKIATPMEKEMEDVIKTPEQVEAAQIILTEYPKIWAKKEMEFWDALWHTLNNKLKSTQIEGFRFQDVYAIWHDENNKPYNNIIENLKNSKVSGFGLKYQFNSDLDLNFRIEKLDDGEIRLSIYFNNGKEERVLINKMLDLLCKEMDFTLKNGNVRYKKIQTNIIFYSNKQTKLSYDLFNKLKFELYISELSDEIMTKIELLLKYENDILESLSQ